MVILLSSCRHITYILDLTLPPPVSFCRFCVRCNLFDGHVPYPRFEMFKMGFQLCNAFLGFNQLLLVRELGTRKL